MLFNSLEFAVFFPVVVAAFFLVPCRWQVGLLLLASCVFYMAFIPAYILVLFATILVDYVAALRIERSEGRTRRFYLVLSIAATCAILFVFKYFNFFAGNLAGLGQWLGWRTPDVAVQIILPIGLSFHTFQSLSYVIEVYRGAQKAESNLGVYATYVMFFPQLVAGPIERPQRLLGQFREAHAFDHARITSGLKRMAWGFFKKAVVADRLALYVNDVFGAPRDHNGLQLSVATVFFAYQIYCDFSGYSDIAVGAARVLGFKLMENFDTPYYATSIGEFWRRWHISLSTWFRDYLYFPLGGNRLGRLRQAANLLVTFVVSGLWHGANWTFVAWGLLNGLYLVTGKATRPLRNGLLSALGLAEGSGLRRSVQMAATFALVCFGWVLFRAKSIEDAVYCYTHFFRDWDFSALKTEHFDLRQLAAALSALILLEGVQLARRRYALMPGVARWPIVPRWGAYAGLVFGVILFGVYRRTEFIYFQF